MTEHDRLKRLEERVDEMVGVYDAYVRRLLALLEKLFLQLFPGGKGK